MLATASVMFLIRQSGTVTLVLISTRLPEIFHPRYNDVWKPIRNPGVSGCFWIEKW